MGIGKTLWNLLIYTNFHENIFKIIRDDWRNSWFPYSLTLLPRIYVDKGDVVFDSFLVAAHEARTAACKISSL
jgi:hypothetical protein